MISRFKASFVILSLAGSAYASPASEEAMDYRTLQIKAMLCKEKYRGDSLKVDMGNLTPTEAYKNFLQCQGAVSTESKAVYKRVMAKTKGADAKKAVKDYQVAFMSYLDGLEPKAGEAQHQYTQRTSALESSLNTAKQRMDLELE
ncbi:hypothetical protein ACCQ08_25035 [Comamonas sp. SY3]|uniref:hypothetical protein n=1 Tax=Comamonas sp. SY3 TaxID=3243601 RepID=UPI0035939490